MKNLNKKTYILAGIFLLVFLIMFSFFAYSASEKNRSEKKRYQETLQSINALPIVENPDEFVQSFNPETEEPTRLQCYGIEGCRVDSTFYPYVELIRIYAEPSKMLGKTLWVDMEWNVFWISTPDNFYGPYKSGKDFE